MQSLKINEKTMIRIEKMIFNTFQVNTYLLWDETAECIVIDPACYEEHEKKALENFLLKNKLTLVRNLNTHCHIDHVLGNDFIAQTYQIYPEYHKNAVPFFYTLKELASSFGYTVEQIPKPARFIEDNEIVRWGNSSLKVFFTPGHAEGSVCFYQEQQGFVITGDVLFKDTVGRTDMPTGDFDQLMNSIKTRLFTLPEQTIVYPGHGPETSIGYEMNNNPFIR
ncbi:MAG: MBL fold metallo-hydrolase [Bacteroidales bacterium]|nr:MBL fold metallo-hydrolase [Bacteroidales bacterium]